MGAQQTQHFDPTNQGWERIDTIGGITTWTKQSTGQLMEENKFMVGTQQQFNYQIDAFNFRYNSLVLVASRYLKRQVKSEVCAAIYEGNLFLEKIQFRLRRVNEIPYPDILHLYSQCFKGFSLLYKQVGPFTITEQMIGVNNNGVVKVWLNSDFASSLPEAFETTKIGETDMLYKLVNMIEQNTDAQTMPLQMSTYLKDKKVRTFDQAQRALVQSFEIPQRMDCVLQDDGQIIKEQPQILQHTLPNHISHNIYSSNVHRVQQHFVEPPNNYQQKVMYSTQIPATISQNTVIIPNSLNSIPTKRTQMSSPIAIQPNIQITNASIKPKSSWPEITPKTSAISNHQRHIAESPLKIPQRNIIEAQRPFASEITLNNNLSGTASQSTIIRNTPCHISASKSPLKARGPSFSRPSPFHFANKPVSPSPLINRTTFNNNNLQRNTIGRQQTIHNVRLQNSQIKRQPSQPQIMVPVSKFKPQGQRATSPLTFTKLKQNIHNNNNITRTNYHQQKSITPRITSPQFAQKIISQNNSTFINNFRQKTPTPNRYPTPSKATYFQRIQQVVPPVQIAYIKPKTIPSEQPKINYSKSTHHEAFINPIPNNNFQDRYQRIQQQSDKTSQEIMNLIRDSRKIKVQQERINQDNFNHSFAVQRFAPTVNQIFVEKRQKQTHIPQLAGSGYISSLYVPLHVNSAVQSGILPNHVPFHIPTANVTQYNNGEARQLYQPQISTYSTYIYQNNKFRTPSYQKSDFSPIKYDEQSNSGASYAKSNYVPQYSNTLYKQQFTTNYHNQQGISYEGMDAEILRDLQKMRANLPLNR